MQLADTVPAQQRAEQHVETGGHKGPPLSATDAPVRKPQDLSEADFHGYLPQARALAICCLPLLRTIPLPLLPLLLREVSALDYRFPRERERVLLQLAQLQAKDPSARERVTAPFRSFDLPRSLAAVDWVNDPGHYLDLLTAALWSSGQMPQFRITAKTSLRLFQIRKSRHAHSPGRRSAVALGPRLPAGKVLSQAQAMQQALRLLG